MFPGDKYYICKYCGRKLDATIGSNTARLISHLYAAHPLAKDRLKDFHLSTIVDRAFEMKGEAK